MIRIAILAVAALALVACKQDKGLAVGVNLQDCPSIAANMRQDAALAINGLDRDAAVATLAMKYSITEAEAGACLK